MCRMLGKSHSILSLSTSSRPNGYLLGEKIHRIVIGESCRKYADFSELHEAIGVSEVTVNSVKS